MCYPGDERLKLKPSEELLPGNEAPFIVLKGGGFFLGGRRV